MAITGRGMDFTGHIASTADTLTGAGTIIAGINQVCVEEAAPAATHVKADAGVLNGSPAQILF